jgi:hypothetical protein
MKRTLELAVAALAISTGAVAQTPAEIMGARWQRRLVRCTMELRSSNGRRTEPTRH